MGVKETLAAGVAATSVMTAFSYAVSAVEGNNFKEPHLLTLFVQRLTLERHPLMPLSGWLLHYTMGCVWAGMYISGVEGFRGRVSLPQAFGFGLFSGATGVLIWRALFRQIPHSPKTAYRKFYRQLFVAHILFALSLAKTYLALKQR